MTMCGLCPDPLAAQADKPVAQANRKGKAVRLSGLTSPATTSQKMAGPVRRRPDSRRPEEAVIASNSSVLIIEFTIMLRTIHILPATDGSTRKAPRRQIGIGNFFQLASEFQ